MSDMPPDPFVLPDLSEFGASCAAMYLALTSAGLSQDVATELTVKLVTSIMLGLKKDSGGLGS